MTYKATKTITPDKSQLDAIEIRDQWKETKRVHFRVNGKSIVVPEKYLELIFTNTTNL